MITWQDVANVAPGLGGTAIASGMQVAILGMVKDQVDDNAWGSGADFGRAYLAAHLASLRFNAGLITSESVGPMSRSYSVPVNQSMLATTIFGMEYLRLLRLYIGPAIFVP